MDGLTEKVPTPRTAALEKTLHAWCGDEAQCLEFAEGLERELIAANARIAKLEAELLKALAKEERGRVAFFEFYNDWKKGDFELPKLAQHDVEAIAQMFAVIDPSSEASG